MVTRLVQILSVDFAEQQGSEVARWFPIRSILSDTFFTSDDGDGESSSGCHFF